MTLPLDISPGLRLRTKQIDAAVLGNRIREARLRIGLTQGEVAGPEMSTAYISRIEGGHRRPSVELLLSLADRLRCTPEDLVAPEPDLAMGDLELVNELALELDYAEIELRTGAHAEARGRARLVVERALVDGVPEDLRRRGELLLALAMETDAAPDETIIALEDVVARDQDPVRLLRALVALSRCYREQGDLARAVDVGERARGLVDDTELTGTPDGLQLAVTVAAAHYERGDVNHAVRMCMRAVEKAGDLASPSALAAAYWNSSIMQADQGNVSSALPLAQKAIGLLESAQDSRNKTRLNGQLGLMLLKLDPPRIEDARACLQDALLEIQFVDRARGDIAWVEYGLGLADFLDGNLDEASSHVGVCREVLADEQSLPMLSAEAAVLAGRIWSARGEIKAAKEDFKAAVMQLSGLGADRSVAQIWYQLGSLMQEHGEAQQALDAYRRAAASTGLHAPAVPQPVSPPHE